MNLSNLCNIVVSERDDYEFLFERMSKYPCNISLIDKNEFNLCSYDIPTIYVGWDFFKNIIPNISILNKQIKDDCFWTFSKNENQEDFLSSIDKFFHYSINKWFPSEIIHFDPIFQDVNEFSKILNNGCKNYVYYNNGGIYINNCDKNFVFNVKNLELISSNPKKTISNFLNSIDIFAFSYSNILECCDEEYINDFNTIEDFCWVKFGIEVSESEFFKLDIPNFDIKKYIPFLMSKINNFKLSEKETKFINRIQKKNRVTYKLSNTYIPFDFNFNAEDLDFIFRSSLKYAKFNFSNKRTVTGRIVNKDVYNLQNIPKDSEDRKLIKPSYCGGKIVVFDYKSFETRISTYLTADQDFIMEYYDKDIHYEAACVIFETINITDEQRNLSKTINHAILYGAGDYLINSKLDEAGISRDKIYEIKKMLKPILDMSNKIKDILKRDGQLINKWGSIIKPNKEYAAFNNYVQTVASEIITDKIFEVMKYLSDKKTRVLFQIHDSVVFDFHPNEIHLINNLSDIMSSASGMFFPVSIKVGDNYKDII